jgi:transposase
VVIIAGGWPVMILVMCVCTCKPAYETSLTDAQWAVIEPLLPVRDRRRGGRPRKFSRRLIVDTVLYVLGTGCAWRLVPHDLAPWDAAYRWFRIWAADGALGSGP